MHSSFLMRYISAGFRIYKICTIYIIYTICTICIMFLAGCMSESRRSHTSTVTGETEQPVQHSPDQEKKAHKKPSGEIENQSGQVNKPGPESATSETKSKAASDSVRDSESSKSTKNKDDSFPQKENSDTAKQWKEAREEVEELKNYRPLFLKPTPLDELLAWVPKEKKVKLFDEKCRPVKVERNEDVLTGPVEVKTKISEGVKRVNFKTAHFGLTVSYTGPSSTSYKKDKKGQWVSSSSGGMGSLETRTGALNRVTKNAAFYGGAVVSLKAVCRSYQSKSANCAGGGKRTCQICRSIKIQAKSRSQGIGFGYIGTAEKSPSSELKEVDCSKPCPVDVLGKKIAQLNAFLKGKEFVTLDSDIENPPILFRTRKACRRHRARRKKSK